MVHIAHFSVYVYGYVFDHHAVLDHRKASLTSVHKID